MIVWRLWMHMRRRAAICLLLVLVNAAALVGIARFARPVVLRDAVPSWIDLGAEDRVEFLSATEGSRALVDTYWLDDSMWLFPLMAVLLSVGGVGTLAWPDSRDLTLSLGASKAKWLVTQALLAVGIVALLAAMSVALVAGGAAGLGEPLPVTSGATRVAQITLACTAWIGLAHGVSAITRRTVLAVLVCASVLALTRLMDTVGLLGWTPWVVPNPDSWSVGAPWAALAVTALLAVGGVGVAVFAAGETQVSQPKT